MHPCNCFGVEVHIFKAERKGRGDSHKTDGFALLKYVNNVQCLISGWIYCTFQRHFSLTGLPNADKHLCFQVKKLSSFKSYRFKSERNKCWSIFKAATGSDKCSSGQSQLEAFVLDLVEHMHTPMHFRLRGPVLDRMLHYTLPRGPNADLLAFITSLLLSSYFLVLPLWSSSPFDLCIDRTTSKKACLPHSLLIPFAPVSPTLGPVCT